MEKTVRSSNDQHNVRHYFCLKRLPDSIGGIAILKIILEQDRHRSKKSPQRLDRLARSLNLLLSSKRSEMQPQDVLDENMLNKDMEATIASIRARMASIGNRIAIEGCPAGSQSEKKLRRSNELIQALGLLKPEDILRDVKACIGHISLKR